jgi:kexin
MLSGPVDEVTEVEALNYHFHENQIFSCSWGPSDDGVTVEGPSTMVEQALIRGVNEGRNGKGSIYIFASGNGGREHDNCNFDGYSNSIYTVTVGAIDQNNKIPNYAEPCSAILLVAYSSNDGKNHIVSRCENSRCLALITRDRSQQTSMDSAQTPMEGLLQPHLLRLVHWL